MFNDSNYCINVKLIQQTPMIHFQAKPHMSAGLGPRATEVKPKLDRFAALWYKKYNNNRTIPDDWMVEFDEESAKKGKKPEHTALNYTLRIVLPDSAPDVRYPDNSVKSVYFGNMGSKRDNKMQIFNTAPVSLYIRCFIPDLKKLLEECIPTFFLLHNFGMRQDKGVGGFITEGMTSSEAEKLLKEWMGNKAVGLIDYSRYVFDKGDRVDGSFWIGEIGTVYRLLKSGLNVNRTYVKSALTEYFLQERQIDGEKKAMKQHGIAPVVYTYTRKIPQKHGGNDKERYIRGLFGYGQMQNWFSSDGNFKKVPEVDPKTHQIKTNAKGNTIYQKDDINISPAANTGIERVPSPLLFKVVEKCIFIIPQDIQVYSQPFEFTSTISPEKLTLEIPSEDEFDMDTFIQWYMQWLDNKNSKRSTVTSGIASHIFEDKRVIKRCL